MRDYNLLSRVLAGSRTSDRSVHILRDEEHGARATEVARRAAALCLPAALATAASVARDEPLLQPLHIFLVSCKGEEQHYCTAMTAKDAAAALHRVVAAWCPWQLAVQALPGKDTGGDTAIDADAQVACTSGGKVECQLRFSSEQGRQYEAVLSATLCRIALATQQTQRLPITSVRLTPAGAAKQQVTLRLQEGYALGSSDTGTKVTTRLAGFGQDCPLNGQRKSDKVSRDRREVTFAAPGGMPRAALQGIVDAVADGSLTPAIVGWLERDADAKCAALACELRPAEALIRRVSDSQPLPPGQAPEAVDAAEAAAAWQRLWALLGSLGPVVPPVGSVQDLGSTAHRLGRLEAQAEATGVALAGLDDHVDNQAAQTQAAAAQTQAAVEELGRRVDALELGQQAQLWSQGELQGQLGQLDADMADAASRKRTRAGAGGPGHAPLPHAAESVLAPLPADLPSLTEQGWLDGTDLHTSSSIDLLSDCGQDAQGQDKIAAAPSVQAGPPLLLHLQVQQSQQQQAQLVVRPSMQPILPPQQQQAQQAFPAAGTPTLYVANSFHNGGGAASGTGAPAAVLGSAIGSAPLEAAGLGGAAPAMPAGASAPGLAAHTTSLLQLDPGRLSGMILQVLCQRWAHGKDWMPAKELCREVYERSRQAMPLLRPWDMLGARGQGALRWQIISQAFGLSRQPGTWVERNQQGESSYYRIAPCWALAHMHRLAATAGLQ